MNLPSRRWIRTLLKLYGFPKSNWSRVCVWFVLVREQLRSLKSKSQSLANAASWPWYVEICNRFVVLLLERFSVQNKRNILTRSTIKYMKDNWPLINIWQTLFWKCYHVGFFFSAIVLNVLKSICPDIKFARLHTIHILYLKLYK